jgi:FAD/FMN-containing dehydrogenase/Fe-S oxidoreductase
MFCQKGFLARMMTVVPKRLPPVTASYQAYLKSLKDSNFKGDIDTSLSARLVHAVDNSIYQFIPQAVVFPASTADVQTLLRLGSTPAFQHITFTARGGGTGTNGQSLNKGIVLDLSRHMNALEEVNEQQGYAWVQAGIVKDALNEQIEKIGYFFSPDTSASSRATIGGMIATDASGSGSLVYGKTSNHLLALEVVLHDGTLLHTSAIRFEAIEHLTGSLQSIVQKVQELCLSVEQAIEEKYPKLNRFVTGYDLKNTCQPRAQIIDLSRLFAGSEGTLGVVTRAKLHLDRRPETKKLIVIGYDSLDAALRHAPKLVAAHATSIELLDARLLQLAQQDLTWHQAQPALPVSHGQPFQALNLVEFAGDATQVAERISQMVTDLEQHAKDYQAFLRVDCGELIQHLNSMRKKAVGLLGKTQGPKKPIAFVEDTAVPPENLADYIQEFRQLLDDAGLSYGMFGHVDAGVLHVRPLLDLQQKHDEALVETLSDQVFALTQKYQGALWGEHGKGVRGVYTQAFFGHEIYQVFQALKRFFDPHHQLNPGKLVAHGEDAQDLIPISAVKRASYDQQIAPQYQKEYAPVLACNGNGVCFNYASHEVLCPSYKATKAYSHSPKGRSTLIREWLRQRSLGSVEPTLISETKDVLEACLGCQACSTRCPVQVDIPTYKSLFNAWYYEGHRRPMQDYLFYSLESVLPWLGRMPRVVNFVQALKWTQQLLKRWGLVDLPKLDSNNASLLWASKSFNLLDIKQLAAWNQDHVQKRVVLIQDPWTSFYDTSVVADWLALLPILGFEPWVLPYKPLGKTLFEKGFLTAFKQCVLQRAEALKALSHQGVSMVCLDPAMAIFFRHEYSKVDPGMQDVQVYALHEWLQNHGLAKTPISAEPTEAEYDLRLHCTEASHLPESGAAWQAVFKHFGMTAHIKSRGCCGMAGAFGHQVKHQQASYDLFQMSWKADTKPACPVLATGFSCRSQMQRFGHQVAKHPISIILQQCQSYHA